MEVREMAIVFAGMGQADFLQIRNIPPWHKSRLLDRVVGTGPAVYERGLFGAANQMLTVYRGRAVSFNSQWTCDVVCGTVHPRSDFFLSVDSQGYQTMAIHFHHRWEIPLVQD